MHVGNFGRRRQRTLQRRVHCVVRTNVRQSAQIAVLHYSTPYIIRAIRFYTVRRKGFRLSFSEIMTRSEGMPQSIANVGSL